GVAGSAQPGALLAPARRTIAIQRRVIFTSDRSTTIARTRGVGARQPEQTANRTGAGGTRRHESPQFRPGFYQRDEDHARKICRASADRSCSPTIGRKSEQHGSNRGRVWLWERQFDAQCLSARAKNSTWPISSSLSTRETPGAKTG